MQHCSMENENIDSTFNKKEDTVSFYENGFLVKSASHWVENILQNTFLKLIEDLRMDKLQYNKKFKHTSLKKKYVKA